LRSLAWCRFLVLAQIETEQIEASGVPLCTKAATRPRVNIRIEDQSVLVDSLIRGRASSNIAQINPAQFLSSDRSQACPATSSRHETWALLFCCQSN
jgi:hypothetical protein